MNLVLSFMFIEETNKHKINQKIHLFKPFFEFFNVFKHKRLGGIYLNNFFVCVVCFGFLTSYPIYIVHTFNLSSVEVSYYMIWMALVSMVASIWINRWVTARYSPQKVLLVSLGAIGVLVEVMISLNTETWLWLVLMFTMIPLSLSLPAVETLLANKAKPKEQGQVFGKQESLGVGSEILTGFSAGAFAAIYPPLSLLLVGFFSLIVAIYLRMKR